MTMLARKKILFISPLLIKGGSERVISTLSRALDARGYDVTVVVYAGPVEYPITGEIIVLDAKSSRTLGGKLLNTIRRIRRLRALMKRIRPDTVISFLGNIAPILAGYPLIVSIRGTYKKLSLIEKIAVNTIYRLPHVRRIVVPSRGLGNFLRTRLGLAKTVSIPNMVDVEWIEAQASMAVDSLPDSYILAVGRLVPVKRFEFLIRAFADAVIPGSTILLIAGEGPERQDLQALIDECCPGRVILVGNVDNPFAYMKRARCLVMSSAYDAFPNVIIESLSCGTPVISVDCDFGPREIIRDGVDGMIVPRDDNAALSRSIERMVLDDDLRDRLAVHAGQRAQDFLLEKILPEWETIISETS